MWAISLLVFAICMIVYYIGIDIALTSLFIYFGINGSIFFGVIGVIIGLLFSFLNEEGGYLRRMIFAGAAGYIAWELRPDGFIYALILFGIYRLIFRDRV